MLEINQIKAPKIGTFRLNLMPLVVVVVGVII